MHCPRCHHPTYQATKPCPNCQFEGEKSSVETLDHIRWLLAEIESWPQLNVDESSRQILHDAYANRHDELEVELRLRRPRLTEDEARQAWSDLVQREILLQQVAEWRVAGLLRPKSTQSLTQQAHSQIEALQEQLDGHTRPDYPHNDEERLAVVDFLIQAVDYLSQKNCFVSLQAERQAQTSLFMEKEQIEIALGLRAPEPIQKPIETLPSVDPATPLQVPQPLTPPLPPAPAIPLRERLWRTLLSERTLQGMLILGIFLLFSAAISFVIWGWRDFSAPLRVAIPSAFTSLFFGLGWYVRTKTPLYRSGIALSAIAALLIPIDFYTVYANFNIPPNLWPSFWLITSLSCLAAYVIVALIIRSRLFGYLVATAAGSTVLAMIEVSHQVAGLSLDWRTAGLSALALGLILLAGAFERRSVDKLRIFAEPFRYISLLAIGVILPLTFGWRYLDRRGYDTLHYALTVDWWLGGLIFGWGAVRYRSQSLGLLAVMALPVATFLTQAAIFQLFSINPAWHAVGFALLVPLYLVSGYKLLKTKNDPILQGHGRAATRWAVVLLVFAALWALTDLNNGAAVTVSHTILAGAVLLAALLWRRPTYLYGASLLAFSAITFLMTTFNFTLPQLSLGWAALAIGHIILAINVATGFPLPLPSYAKSLVIAGYVIGGLALFPPLFPYDGHLLAYALGNWLALTAWGGRLAHTKQSGFTFTGDFGKSMFHWFTALPLPIWLWLLFLNRGPLGSTLPLALAVLAWGMILLSYRLDQANPAYGQPWYLSGLLVSLIALPVAFIVAPSSFTPATTLLIVGLLYFADAVSRRQSLELVPAGVVTAGSYLLFLNRLNLSFDIVTCCLTLLIGLYHFAGLWRRKSTWLTTEFFTPLYLTAHVLTLLILLRVFARPFGQLILVNSWTDEMRLWGAAAQLLLGLIYGLYAWYTYKERWGHAAAWLLAAGGGFIAITFSSGRGASAAEAATGAILFVLAERLLHWLRYHPRLLNHQQTFFRFTWRLYRRPLLVTGWAISGMAIGLALIRNLWLLGGGYTQQIWAAIGLLLITGLYALSARLFRRARFVWLAAVLLFAPWTILTNLGWFTTYRPSISGFALSWVILAWDLFLSGLLVQRFAAKIYALPLMTVAHLLLPFSLLWGAANVETSRFTYALAIGLYGLAARLDYTRLKKTPEVTSLPGAKFLYPALGLVPVWSLYLLAWQFPGAQAEHYGLLLLGFGPLGLVAGAWLRRITPQAKLQAWYALPAYLTGYLAVSVGTLLVVYEPPLLSLVLLFDALLLLVSAWLFKNSLWLYPATVLTPVSLLLALHETDIPSHRYGWWLIGLASIYLAAAWILERVKLPSYRAAPLAAGLILTAISLISSSQDQIGALWGYGGATLLYAVGAFWLRRPPLLLLAATLIVVPYMVGLQLLEVPLQFYGLALFPGAITALGFGWYLDRHFGAWRDFPWSQSLQWPLALWQRVLRWWGLPLYLLGFSLALVSPFFTELKPDLAALNFLLLMPMLGWAIYRFRLRIWLVTTTLAGHLAVVYYLSALGWWSYPAWAWLRFLPVTLLTTLIALGIEIYRREGSPLKTEQMFKGWSRPLYIIISFDIIIAQLGCLQGNGAAATVTLIHALLIALFASLWLANWMSYISIGLGAMALVEWVSTFNGPVERLPVILSLLALAYGVSGYGLTFTRQNLDKNRSLRPWLALWELPLQRSSLFFSLAILLITASYSLNILNWTLRALLGFPFRHLVDLVEVQMFVGVFGLLGLLYLTAAVAHRWVRLGYIAFAMLLTSWGLQAFYIQEWANVQWYTLPAGLYLLSIAHLERKQGNGVPARWLDYTAIGLMMGSLFWQTLLFGWVYALLLGAEGLAAFWWGSAQRLRRFLYAGMIGVMLATLGQLINSLWSINQWIVFGAIGLLLVLLAIVIERKLDDIKLWQETLEAWE